MYCCAFSETSSEAVRGASGADAQYTVWLMGLEARVDHGAVKAALVVRAMRKPCAAHRHLRRTELRTALRRKARHGLRRVVHKRHMAACELLTVRRHLKPRRT